MPAAPQPTSGLQLIHVLLLGLLVIAGCLIALILISEPQFTTGLPHPQYQAMNIGGDGLARLGDAVGLIGALGGIMVLMMVLFCALGVRPQRRSWDFWALMMVAVVAAQFVWWSMYLSYLDFLRTGETEFVLSFPVATSWMLYGVWISGMVLAGIYVFGFRRYIFSFEDEAEYEALRAQAAVPRKPPENN